MLIKIIFSLLFFYQLCCFSQNITVLDSLNNYFSVNNVSGSFSVYDLSDNIVYTSDSIDYHTSYIPASTFKIFNSLTALETGIAQDENFVIKWDGVSRSIPVWNKDTYMREAFRNSTVWYYQEIARRIGEERMKEWIEKTSYGNLDIKGGIDRFWLDGALRISPEQQINFIKKLYKNELPFSQRSMNIVKSIMARDTIDNNIIYAKTGWGSDSLNDIGWFVGYTETENKTNIFALIIRSPLNTDNNFAQKRIDITYQILKSLRFIK